MICYFFILALWVSSAQAMGQDALNDSNNPIVRVSAEDIAQDAEPCGQQFCSCCIAWQQQVAALQARIAHLEQDKQDSKVIESIFDDLIVGYKRMLDLYKAELDSK